MSRHIVANLIEASCAGGGTFALSVPIGADADWIDDQLRRRVGELLWSDGLGPHSTVVLSLSELQGCDCNLAYNSILFVRRMKRGELIRMLAREVVVLARELRRPVEQRPNAAEGAVT